MKRITRTLTTLALGLTLATAAAAESGMYRMPDGRLLLTNFLRTDGVPVGATARRMGVAQDTPSVELVAWTEPTPAAESSVDVEEATEGFCADRWPNDFTMQASCTNRQYQAIMAVDQRMKRVGADQKGSKPNLAFRTCMDRWQAPLFRTYDWVMVDSCFERQLKALGQLGG